MNLEDFITEAIGAIASGVKKGRQSAISHGVVIGNALYGNLDKNGVSTSKHHTNTPVPEFIEFDIAVAVQKSGGGKAGISVMGMNLGNIEGEIKNETISHIRLKIPVHWEIPDSHYGLKINQDFLKHHHP